MTAQKYKHQDDPRFLSRAGLAWDEIDDLVLITSLSNTPPKVIARGLERSLNSVRTRVSELGISNGRNWRLVALQRRWRGMYEELEDVD